MEVMERPRCCGGCWRSYRHGGNRSLVWRLRGRGQLVARSYKEAKRS